MSEKFRPTTPPNTPERLREVDGWMARQTQAAVDKLLLTLRESAEEARIFGEGIELVEGVFSDPPISPKEGL